MAKPDFDSIKHLNPYNVEYSEARELMPLLGYGNKWQNFVDVIKKAMISCETTGNIVTDHFTAPVKWSKSAAGRNAASRTTIFPGWPAI